MCFTCVSGQAWRTHPACSGHIWSKTVISVRLPSAHRCTVCAWTAQRCILASLFVAEFPFDGIRYEGNSGERKSEDKRTRGGGFISNINFIFVQHFFSLSVDCHPLSITRTPIFGTMNMITLNNANETAFLRKNILCGMNIQLKWRHPIHCKTEIHAYCWRN